MLSQGLTRENTYRNIEDRVLSQRWYTSGDSLFTESIFTHMGILPTDPGMPVFNNLSSGSKIGSLSQEHGLCHRVQGWGLWAILSEPIFTHLGILPTDPGMPAFVFSLRLPGAGFQVHELVGL